MNPQMRIFVGFDLGCLRSLFPLIVISNCTRSPDFLQKALEEGFLSFRQWRMKKEGSIKAEPLSEVVITILSISYSSINSWIVIL